MGAAFAILACTRFAHAEEQARAEPLFREARDLLAKGDAESACPKLEESQRLDPAPGTEFNLARCYELTGRLASAWGAYADVAAITHAAGQSEREARARERVAAIEPRLSFVVVRAHDAGVALTRDGKAIARAELDVPIPVDPGAHVVRAAAPGKRAWEMGFAIDAEAQRVTIEVPALEGALEGIPTSREPERARDAPAAQDAPPPAPPAFGAQRALAVGALGGAVVAGGLGAYFGIRKIGLASDARAGCDARGCDPAASSAAHDSNIAGDASTVSFVACGALAATSAVLWLTAPSPSRRVTVAPGVAPGTASLIVRAVW